MLLFFFYIHSESSAFISDNYFGILEKKYLRLPETESYNVGFQIQAGKVTKSLINNLLSDFSCLKEDYYASTANVLLTNIAKGQFHKYSFNLNKRDFICLSKAGLVTR